MYFTERKATVIVILYVQFITLSVTFHLGLDLPKCLYFSGFPTEIFLVILISPVRFSCPTCRTVCQFTTHHQSVNSTNNAAPHCAILFIPLPLLLSSHQISPSVYVLSWYFFVSSLEHKHKHKHSPSNTHNSVLPIMFIHNPVLMCEIRVISINCCIRYARVQYPHISNQSRLLLKDKGGMYICPYNSE